MAALEAGPFTFEGRGAGEEPTTSAVIADLVDVARGANGPLFGRPVAATHDHKPQRCAWVAGTSPAMTTFGAQRDYPLEPISF